MAAPKGNEYWKERTKSGRDKIFKTPEALWEAAKEYFEWADNNPWIKNEAVKSGDLAGTIMQVPTQRPYTLSGLCLHLDVNEEYLTDFNIENEERKEDFSRIITRIRETIRTQKFEGATVGAFNATIIARDLGLADKTEGSLSVNWVEERTNEPE